MRIFANPNLPQIDDYYEPFTFDYEHLQSAPEMKADADRTSPQPDHRQADGQDRLGAELGGDPRRRIRQAQQGHELRRHAEGHLRPVREHLHDVPAAPVRALPQPGLRRVLPVGLDLQARGRRHRADRPGQVPRLAHVRQRAARTRRSTTTGRAARPRSASSAIRASRRASRPCAARPASGASATSACCSTTPTASRRRRASSTTGTCTRRSSTSSSIRSIRRSSRRRASTASPTTGWRPRASSPVYKMAVQWKVALPLHPEYRTLPMVWYVPPLSPISAAANAGQVGANGEIPDVNQLRIPVQVPRQPADRRRHAAGGAGARAHAGDARLPARQARRQARSTRRCWSRSASARPRSRRCTA